MERTTHKVRGARRVLPLVLGLSLLAPCEAGDLLRLHNTVSREVGVLVDGTRDGLPVNDERYVKPDLGGFFDALFPVIPLDNFTLATGGSNEVIAFARRRPVTLVEDVDWTALNNDVDVTFDDEYAIPVYIWIVKGPFDSTRATAASHAVTTSMIWTNERMGVVFGDVDIRDATQDPDAEGLLHMSWPCVEDAALKTDIGHEPGALNIYYLETVQISENGPHYTSAGVWCPEQIIAMGYQTTGGLLAHEIGHGFDLRHTNNPPLDDYFDATNVMWRVSASRRYLSEGQTFRAIHDPSSALNNMYDVRAGRPVRNCPHGIDENDLDCPPLQKRIWQDGAAWPPN